MTVDELRRRLRDLPQEAICVAHEPDLPEGGEAGIIVTNSEWDELAFIPLRDMP